MRLVKLKPYGYCEGVAFALSQLDKITTKHRGHKIYLIGWLIHNEMIMRALAKKHVIVLDDQAVSRLNLLKKIPAKKNAVVVLSAHGSEKNTLSYAKNNFGYCYDLTCKYIHENIKIINELLDKKNIIIFLGKKNHPETKAILSYSPKIIYIESIKDLSKIKFGATKKYCLLNQTTMPQYAISDSLKDIKYPNLHWINTTCHATALRHANILKLKKETGLIVVGDVRSNNTQQLVALGKKQNLKVYCGNDIKSFHHFKFIKEAYAITSGTSTSSMIVDEIEKDLNYQYDVRTPKLNKLSKLKESN